MTNPPEVIRNQAELENWDKYVNKLPGREAALLPLNISIDKTGRMFRSLIKASVVQSFYKKNRPHIPPFINAHNSRTPTMTHFPKLDMVVKDYIDSGYFKDGSQSQRGLNPLDINTNRPTYMLFRLAKRDLTRNDETFVKWRFSEDKQITCHNDGLGPYRNVLPICTLDNGKALLALNRHRCNPPTMKFDLHVTIHQKGNIGTKKKPKWIDVSTPIIIDPGLGNKGSGLP